MRAIKLLTLVYLYMATLSLASSVPAKSITVRVTSFNVIFGKLVSPEQFGEMFKPYNLDIIGFDEVPDGDWSVRVGKLLGVKYS